MHQQVICIKARECDKIKNSCPHKIPHNVIGVDSIPCTENPCHNDKYKGKGFCCVKIKYV